MKMKRKINCNECGSFLFETENESDGAAGAEAQSKGFVFKMPFLFTDKFTSLFFCDHNCGKAFYSKNIPKNDDASKIIESLKADIPKMSKEICDRMQKIKEVIQKNR